MIRFITFFSLLLSFIPTALSAQESPLQQSEVSALDRFVAQEALRFTDENIAALKEGYVENSQLMFFCQEHQMMEPKKAEKNIWARRDRLKEQALN